MPATARAWVVWASALLILMGLFLLVAYGTGWPGTPDRCVPEVRSEFSLTNNECFCERFELPDVMAGKTGVRQPVNTWSNLYAIGTSLFVTIMIFLNRLWRNGRNPMQDDHWLGDVYIVAVMFLGLGSMWFHASISMAVSWADSMSMFVYAGFLVFYTLDRGFRRHNTGGSQNERLRKNVFMGGYGITIALFTFLGFVGVPSFILIGILVLVYLGLEFFWAGFIYETRAMAYWLLAVMAIQNAIVFWALSQTGKPLCNPESSFQPHGYLWHILAGVMAVLMFMYWRREGHPRD